MFKANDKDTRTTAVAFRTRRSSVFIVNFEQVNAGWVYKKARKILKTHLPSKVYIRLDFTLNVPLFRLLSEDYFHFQKKSFPIQH